MIANAGMMLCRPLLDSKSHSCSCQRRSAKGHIATVEEFDRLMAVNVRSVMLCYKYAAKQMIAQGRGGRIIGAEFSYPISFSPPCATC